MEEKILFFTGFPGFLGREILKKILQQDDLVKVFALVEPTMFPLAKSLLEKIKGKEKVELVKGDITVESLGIEERKRTEIQQKVTHVFHLAAIYDLAVKYKRAFRVNVKGTVNVLNFLEQTKKLKKFIYFSTAYVAGWRKGTVYEEELIDGGFKNNYELTKFLAEKAVRERINHIPTVIIRPAIVVGNSRTGEIPKFDGPYYMMNFFACFPKRLPLPYIGKGQAEVNLVPVDFIVEATQHLFSQKKALGKTFHLADPKPMKAREIYREIHRRMKGEDPIGLIVPASLVKTALYVPFIRNYFKVIPQVMAYLSHQQHFDTSNSQELLFSRGMKPPHLLQYLDNLINYFMQHRKEKEKFVLGKEVRKWKIEYS